MSEKDNLIPFKKPKRELPKTYIRLSFDQFEVLVAAAMKGKRMEKYFILLFLWLLITSLAIIFLPL